MSYTVTLSGMTADPKIAVVGCGGTGGFVAEGLCRLLVNSDIPLFLIDPDRVEPHNLLRQNFFPGDVGKFKSKALGERLARQYGRQVGYSVYPYDGDMFDEPLGGGMISKQLSVFVIGCVDNALARRSIASSNNWERWWLDAGNGHHSGQVLIGNTKDRQGLNEAFNERDHTVQRLPLPSLQLPSLLVPPVGPVIQRDCAEAVEDDEQSPTINQAMATLVLDFMYRLLKGTLTWMGAYINMDAGTLQMVPAEPVTVARMCGVKVENLMANACALGARYHIQARDEEDD